MKKNGYIEVIVTKEIDGVKKGDILFVNSTNYSKLPNESIITCITKNNDEIIIPKGNLKVKI